MNVYLINDCEYVAADSEESARQYHSDYPHSDPSEVEVRIANTHGYYDDIYESGTDGPPSRTMIEQAEILLSQGGKLPFQVAVSSDQI